MVGSSGQRASISAALTGAVVVVALACPLPGAAAGAATASVDSPPVAPASWALLQRCEKCHNTDDWAGGVAFETMSAKNIPADAEIWEKAVRKLRGRLMPPPGQAQPDQRTIDSFVHFLEGQLDAAAAERPAPGDVGLHRLNRTEYARSIQAMLGLEVDVKTMLPKDVSSDGFDNIAATLRTSPLFVEQYVAAARNVSRQAIGRANAKPTTAEYRVSPNFDQLEHVDGLPLGTRGGMAIERFFPADGVYEFSIRPFYLGGSGYITKIDAPHRVILTIDGARVFDHAVGGAEEQKAVDQHPTTAAAQFEAAFEHIRVRLKAGTHHVGVTFIQRSFAESDSPLQPIAELPEMERTPGIPGVDISGPFDVTSVGDTESRRRIFICRPASQPDERPCAQRILANLAQEAFRRPVTQDDLRDPMAFYDAGRAAGGDFDAGIESGLTAILSSTKFLYRTDPLPRTLRGGALAGANLIVPVDPTALASRLSFLLWSEGPDQELIDLAVSGRLNGPRVLQSQVHRMLADARSESLVTNFAFQWLGIDNLDTVEPTPELYPTFNENLRAGFREEIRLFLDSILRSDRSVLELLSSDQTFLNERVALQYGVPNIRGDQFRPVRLHDPNRWGLLGKGAVLMSTAYGNRTSPVLRGAWIMSNILGTPPESPLPGVPAFRESEPGKKVLTVRERLETHRRSPTCASCHGVIDPLGFALEGFDVTAAWRTRDLDAGTAIDSESTLADGTPVNGPVQLRNWLLAHPQQFIQTITEKVMTFALGRSLRYEDMPTVRAIVRQASGEGDTFEAIIRGVVQSPAFTMREIPVATFSSKQAALTAPSFGR